MPPETAPSAPPRPPVPEPGLATLHVALIEDSPEYALLVREMLASATEGPLEIAHFESMSAALPHLGDQPVDCVLMDLGLPDTTGLGGLAQVQSVAPELPIVVLSGEQSEEIAVQAVHEGAQDYLVKRAATGEQVLRSVRYAMERKRAQVALAHQALHDSLTGLPNRTLLMDRTEQALARAERTNSRVALLFLDLDRFKLVNDSLGHDAGDRLLCRVAERLKSLIRPSDTVARFGGDEFMVLCDQVEDDRQAILVAERLSGGLAEPFVLEGRELFVGASIGIAFGADRSATSVSLIRDADQAMYRAKERGSRYEMADGTASRRAAVRLSTETQLHRALDRHELRLFYQPEVDLARNTIFSVEALLRWQHPDRGMLGPGDFLSNAEENGLIVPDRRMGHRHRGHAAGRLAQRRPVRPRHDHQHQPLAAPAGRARPAGDRRGGHRARRHPARGAVLRDHRERGGRRRGRGHAPPGPAARAGRRAEPGRLRRRPVVAERAGPLPAGHAQDRPLVRGPAGQRRRARRAHVLGRPGRRPRRRASRPWPRASRRVRSWRRSSAWAATRPRASTSAGPRRPAR